MAIQTFAWSRFTTNWFYVTQERSLILNLKSFSLTYRHHQKTSFWYSHWNEGGGAFIDFCTTFKKKNNFSFQNIRFQRDLSAIFFFFNLTLSSYVTLIKEFHLNNCWGAILLLETSGTSVAITRMQMLLFYFSCLIWNSNFEWKFLISLVVFSQQMKFFFLSLMSL